MCFKNFSPIRNDPKKTHKQIFGTHPVPGQSREFVYVYVFSFPERVQKELNDGTKSRNEGTKKGAMVPKTGTRAHAPKPPCYTSTLLSEKSSCP